PLVGRVRAGPGRARPPRARTHRRAGRAHGRPLRVEHARRAGQGQRALRRQRRRAGSGDPLRPLRRRSARRRPRSPRTAGGGLRRGAHVRAVHGDGGQVRILLRSLAAAPHAALRGQPARPGHRRGPAAGRAHGGASPRGRRPRAAAGDPYRGRRFLCTPRDRLGVPPAGARAAVRNGRAAGRAIVFGLSLTAGAALADAPAHVPTPAATPTPTPTAMPTPAAPSLPFAAGERLAFKMTYARLLAGRAEIAVQPGVYEGRPVFRLSLDVRSEGFFAWLFRYKVDDHTVATWDPATGCSFGIEKHLREGRAIRDQVVRFDPVAGIATVEDRKIAQKVFQV